MESSQRIRHSVFWPPFLLLVAALSASFIDAEGFRRASEAVNAWLLLHFAKPFAWGAVAVFGTCVAVYFSPLGKIVLGGEGAERSLKPFDWFAVSLCVNTAVGILFWAAAEPLYHLTAPPESLGIEPGSRNAAVFALSSLYLHWSFVPSSLYALPALAFALAFHQRNRPFSLTSCLDGLGVGDGGGIGAALDGLCVFCLVAGMAASMATGILTLAGGLEYMHWAKSSPWAWAAIGTAIVVTFLASSLSGLDRGIRWLSVLNSWLFFVFLGIAIVWGPLREMLSLGRDAFVDFTASFPSRTLLLSYSASDPWPRAWTVFYWAVWLAWAPVTALFLGRIARGYSVRQFLWVNLILPGLFAIVWMTIFGGTALSLETSGAGLSRLLAEKGPESLAYALLERYPLAWLFIPTFLITVFVSYVTSADSNTSVIAGLCSSGIGPECPEPRAYLKILWGAVLGSVAIVALCFSGVDGIRTLSYLGGVPALFFELAAMVGLWRMLARSRASRARTLSATAPSSIP